jgi:hypothetical protein
MGPEETTLYLRRMPRQWVREAKAAASRRGSTVAAVVADALATALEGGGGDDAYAPLRESMDWYEKNRRRLLRRHRGEYVAILDRGVVDHDQDFESLAARVFARHGLQPVFMPRVEEGEATARVRSPRRVGSRR